MGKCKLETFQTSKMQRFRENEEGTSKEVQNTTLTMTPLEKYESARERKKGYDKAFYQKSVSYKKGYVTTQERTPTDEKQYTCLKCYKTFNGRNSLKVHERTHTGEKPFACPKCPYVCTNSSNLKKHVRTHTSEKPFICPKCDRSFRTNGELNQHKGTGHIACSQ